jgi:D-lactate dehydrogenase (cytochrome)
LNHHLRQEGLFFPVDPGAEATLGGMASTRASGTNAVRYGTMADNILALTVVLPGGEVIKTGTRARKSSAGYDLTHLFVGAEGTLGVITEITLRLQGVPEAMSSAVVGFDDFDSAVKAVTEIRQVGIPVARIEFLDEVMVQAVNQFSNLGLVERPTLFLEFHGTNAAVKESAEMSAEITHAWGGSDFQWAVDNAERNALWKARHNAYFAGLAFRPGSRSLTTDVCVPISMLAECIIETKKDINHSSLTAPIVGHVGDGNFHLLLLADPDNPEELEQAEQLNERLVERALAMGGTITGEHGVGLGKMKFKKAEHGNALAVMHTVGLEKLQHPGDDAPIESPSAVLGLAELVDGAFRPQAWAECKAHGLEELRLDRRSGSDLNSSPPRVPGGGAGSRKAPGTVRMPPGARRAYRGRRCGLSPARGSGRRGGWC